MIIRHHATRIQSVLPTYPVVPVFPLFCPSTNFTEYGVCGIFSPMVLHMLIVLGIGSYCLGGCDPEFSYSVASCMPAPQCQNKTYTFGNISQSLTEYSTYLGNAGQYDWTYSGYPLQYGENILLTMPANSAGTVIMNSHYVWYGKISVTMKTSRDQGVVSASMYFLLAHGNFF